jgi:hypothetical protein
MDKRRKELLFLGAGLAVLLLALYFTFKPSTPAARATTQPPQPAAAPVEQPQPSAEIQASAMPVPMSASGTREGRNPFAPSVSTTAAAAPVGSGPPITTAMAPPPSLPLLRPIGLELFPNSSGPESGPGPSVITPAAPGPPAEAPLRLTGVIYGNPSIAIIRKGEQRYFVRPGDPVGSRYVVQSIEHRRVVLVGAQGLAPLQLDLTGRL